MQVQVFSTFSWILTRGIAKGFTLVPNGAHSTS